MTSVAFYPGSSADDTRAAFAQWLRVAWHALAKDPISQWLNRSHLSLELQSGPGGMAMVLAFPSGQAQTVLTRQLAALLPGSEILPPPSARAVSDADGLATELVLLRGEKATLQEWKTAQPDPARELLIAAADLQPGERAAVQLMLRPSPHGSGLLGAPTFQALLRLAAFAPTLSRRRTIRRAMAAALGAHHGPGWFRPNAWVVSQRWLRPVVGGRRLDPFWLRLPPPHSAAAEDEDRQRRIRARSRSEFMASRRAVDEALRRERSIEDDREVGDLRGLLKGSRPGTGTSCGPSPCTGA